MWRISFWLYQLLYMFLHYSDFSWFYPLLFKVKHILSEAQSQTLPWCLILSLALKNKGWHGGPGLSYFYFHTQRGIFLFSSALPLDQSRNIITSYSCELLLSRGRANIQRERDGLWFSLYVEITEESKHTSAPDFWQNLSFTMNFFEKITIM